MHITRKCWSPEFCGSYAPLNLEISWNLLLKQLVIVHFTRKLWSPKFCGSYAPLNLKISPNILLKQLVSVTPLKLLNRISWNLVGSKDTICSCAYYQEILISWILWELCPFELRNFRKILLKQLVSTTPLKLPNRISWNLVGSKDTICSCAYYQEMLIP